MQCPERVKTLLFSRLNNFLSLRVSGYRTFDTKLRENRSRSSLREVRDICSPRKNGRVTRRARLTFHLSGENPQEIISITFIFKFMNFFLSKYYKLKSQIK